MNTDPNLETRTMGDARSNAAAQPRPPRIEGFEILELLGVGGMGEVWLAQQKSSIRRKVAVKVIKPGMDSRQILARFEAERQAVAMMDHPAIAKVFSAGTTQSSRPYFAMEYVQGMPLHEYCDRHRLPIAERLRLLQRVCRGVQHAHQRAVIHRDLKPTNILVTRQDGVAQPKIIDFGVAKALAGSSGEDGLHTRLGALLGTPRYMSPEQARGTGEVIDTRADVFSLGVILYELLVGVLPFWEKEENSTVDELRRRICEVDPVRPSARVMSRDETSQRSSAEARRIAPTSFSGALRGDLDWIVLKALEKDPEDRYSSPAELEADLERHLSDRPILARPRSPGATVVKFMKRHRLAVAAAAVTLVSVLVGSGVSIVQASRARAAEATALEQAAAATQAREETEEVVRYLVQLFRTTDPYLPDSGDPRASDLAKRGLDRIDELAGQPLTQARLQRVLGQVYSSLGQEETSVELLRQSLATRREHLPADHLDVAAALSSLGSSLAKTGLLSEAEEVMREALEIRMKRNDEVPTELATNIGDLGTVLMRQGRFEGALELFERSLAIRRRELGDDAFETFMMKGNIGGTLAQMGKLEEATPYLTEALEGLERHLGEEDPRTAMMINNLGALHYLQADYEKALPLLERSLEAKRRVLGEEHPMVPGQLKNVALTYLKIGQPEKALPLAEQAVAMGTRVQRVGSSEYLSNYDCLALVYLELGRLEEAERLSADVVRQADNDDVPDHELAAFLEHRAQILAKMGRRQDARDSFSRALSIFESALGDDHPSTREIRVALAELAAN